MKFARQSSESFGQNTTKDTGTGMSTSTAEAMGLPVVRSKCLLYFQPLLGPGSIHFSRKDACVRGIRISTWFTCMDQELPVSF